ncbi:hypothetical protein CYMTET_33086, partial [Cymbomonas tetramitiformis]
DMAASPLTLLHGDFRWGNLFIKDSQPIVFDWQFVSQGQGVYDLAYFMGVSLTVDDRRSLHDSLLMLYLETLQRHGVHGIDMNWIRMGYQRASLLAFASFVIGAATCEDSTHARQVHQTALYRLSTAILDTAEPTILRA